ncbi:MAG: hypothetical protein ACR2G5_14360 [Pyrinomonadaceae bacterium]
MSPSIKRRALFGRPADITSLHQDCHVGLRGWSEGVAGKLRPTTEAVRTFTV